jgi:uncharacterized membrane protein YfcA
LAKGISGMGLPVVAIPILTVLFDLQTAIAVTILSTVVTDIIILARMPKDWGVMRKALVLVVFGAVGIILGTYFLVNVNQLILSGVLGIVILIFVVTNFFSLLPTIKRRTWLDAVFGFVGGTVQGASGASGPIISMYMLQMKLSRSEFLFLINSFFLVVDSVQFLSVYKLGLYQGPLVYYSFVALVPTVIALFIALALQKRISDRVFRNSVLVLLLLSAILLLYKASHVFL